MVTVLHRLPEFPDIVKERKGKRASTIEENDTDDPIQQCGGLGWAQLCDGQSAVRSGESSGD
jgi:hypothetical protein